MGALPRVRAVGTMNPGAGALKTTFVRIAKATHWAVPLLPARRTIGGADAVFQVAFADQITDGRFV